MGAKSLDLLSLPDNRLDSLDRLDIIQKLEQVIFQIKPDIIYTHHVGDVNIDHSYLHQAIVTACRPIPGFNLHRLLTFEIASSTEWQTPYSSFPFLPNVFVNIEHTWELKKKALDAYSCEMRNYPHPRSVESVEIMAKMRGTQVGIPYAEAFSLLREIS